LSLNAGSATSGSGLVKARFVDPSGNIARAEFSYSISNGDQILLFLSKTQVKSGDGDSVQITARVTNASGAFIAGRQVNFAVTGGPTIGLITVDQGITDANGTAKASLTPGVSDFSNRTIEVTATPQPTEGSAASATARATVNVVGTSIALTSSASAIQLGDPVTITARATDGNNNPIANARIRLSSSNNNFAPEVVTTNASGVATKTYNVTTASGGNETVSATSTPSTVTTGALGATATPVTIAATGTRFEFVSPAADAELKTGVSPSPANTITMRWLEGTTPQNGQQVRFVATRGTIIESSGTPNDGVVTLAGAGQGSITIESNTAGPISVEVSSVSNPALKITRRFEFVAQTPTKIAVQVAQNVLSPGQQTQVTATLRDALDNPVKNRTVKFSNPTDPSGGSLSAATVVTGSDGSATVTYTAGAISSSTNGVTLRAEDLLLPALTTDATLTVGGDVAFITLGTGNTIREINATTYGLPYTVSLTNSAGQPIPNATVTLSIVPTRYFKGYYVAGPQDWAPLVTAGCANEDSNRNTLLDAGEDFNNSGTLEPGNVITISSGTVTTDASGFANFEVRYAQQYGNWVEVALRASRNVSGTESVNTAIFVPPISTEDAKINQSPPGRSFSNPGAVGSPYGRQSDCSINEMTP
ncbi:MAG: Ig-like domain-containing protein, partial [Moraxellaceae bacterium]